jgi:hypothetical protein
MPLIALGTLALRDADARDYERDPGVIRRLRNWDAFALRLALSMNTCILIKMLMEPDVWAVCTTYMLVLVAAQLWQVAALGFATDAQYSRHRPWICWVKRAGRLYANIRYLPSMLKSAWMLHVYQGVIEKYSGGVGAAFVLSFEAWLRCAAAGPPPGQTPHRSAALLPSPLSLAGLLSTFAPFVAACSLMQSIYHPLPLRQHAALSLAKLLVDAALVAPVLGCLLSRPKLQAALAAACEHACGPASASSPGCSCDSPAWAWYLPHLVLMLLGGAPPLLLLLLLLTLLLLTLTLLSPSCPPTDGLAARALRLAPAPPSRPRPPAPSACPAR